jgi:hypothetical protein
LLLTAVALILLVTGLFLLVSPPEHTTVLAGTHPNLWWGTILLVVGLIFALKNRKTIVS